MANKKINVTNLDFDTIKANLKTYLQGQSEFQDYDFEGSGMSVLLDILAYNTHYTALYNNLAINEMFLDSASKRNSIVSLSKMLGYTPRSATSAKATVTLTVNTPVTGPSSLTLPAYTTFTTTVDGVIYTFYTTESYTVTGASTSYVFSNIVITEGKPLSFKYAVSDGSKFIIPNVNADITTLNVRVQESSISSVYTTFTSSSNITSADSTSNVYFVKEIDDGLYEVYFGDGIIGSALENGNVVHLDYFVSNLNRPNGAKLFSYTGDVLISGSTKSITVIDPASSGNAVESIESIRFNAPKMYSAQNRAVTPEDYKAIIFSELPEAQAVSVWGGEDNVPPVYGKVFICVKPISSEILTEVQKLNLTENILSSKHVVSVIPEIVDPEYLDISLNVSVYYNERETTRTAAEIQTIVTDTIINYNNSDLQNFDGVFRFSKLSRLIDSSEPSIENNITTVTLRRQIAPRYNTNAQYNLNIINPIYTAGVAENSITSSGIIVSGSTDIHYIDDDGLGKLRLYKLASNGSKNIVNPNLGTVTYKTGLINITRLNITALAGSTFDIIIKPQSNDVVSALTQIARIEPSLLTVTVISDKSSNGDLRGGYNYKFSSSRT
jgi:hypothetical protein